jgi:drug/metabolite transporter (DMT)-like permease
VATDSQNQHRLGLILVALAALCWSQAGVYTRLIEADLMTMLFWRGLFSGTAAFIFYCLIERRFAVGDALKMGWPGLGVMVLSSFSMICGIGSIRYGKVADAMVIYATVPFITAALAYIFIGERPTRSTIIASLAALAGVVLMIAGLDFGGAATGLMLAVGMALSMACFSTLMRQHRHLPMLPALAGSAYLTALLCLPFASTLSVTSTDLMWIAMFGVLQNASGLALYTLGTKRVPAAEATLLAALEVPFTPFWVWLLMNEQPGLWTLIGGGIVLIALFAHIFGEFRRGSSTTESEFAPTA